MLEGLRRREGAIKARELIQVARKLGRKPVNRGSEPTYEFDVAYVWARALTIPFHGTKNLPIGTARNILNHLEADLEQLKLECTRENANGADQNGSNGTASD